MIAGIVLAGGQSNRMGHSKALLRAGHETFLERAIRTLKEGGCGEVVVVLDPDNRALVATAEDARGRSAWAVGTEQIDSLRMGLKALPGSVEAALVLPVDHPLVESTTVARLIEVFNERHAPVVLPVCDDQRGHPVLFSVEIFDEFLKPDLPEGARSVVHAYSDEVEEVEVADQGVLIDVDTPEDYDEHMGRIS